ncbi:poly(A) RNA polymerase gld-2 homolog A-like isoform X2 [Periplaneta americana]|uniref:poly(A) RNA polymerase gld-2 homolog A-like isoform X2 n=1 Tax=Periplaneta americana TaxID=6978 RepID=UPI0037E9848F
MYHAMFSPHMVVHLVGQQQQQQQQQHHHHHHHHNTYSDTNNNNNNRQNRILTNNCYNHTPFEHPYPLELLQLMGLEMPPIRNRGYSHHPPGGRGGGAWRDRGALHGSASPLMPPPIPLGFRPLVHNSTIKRNYWNKNNGRPPRSQRDPTAINSDVAYSSSSDSGFSSRSPTPSKQQLQQSTHSDIGPLQITDEESDDIQSGSNSLDSKGIKRLHEVYGTPTHNNAIGNGHHQQQPQQNQQVQHQYFHQQSTPQSVQTLSSLQFCQQQQTIPSDLIRSENSYQSKRRYHSGKHSPPPPVPPHSHRTPRGGRRLNGVLLPFSGGLGPPFCIADRFLSHAHLVQVTRTPPQLTTGSDWDKLSEGIWNKFMIYQQTEDTYKKKMMLWKYLYIFIKSSFPRYGLYLVGSTMNGFGSDNSDVDMCLLVRHAEMDQRNEAVGHLEQILKYLRRCEFIEQPELIQAKVPILKFRDTRYCLEVDLNCNNAVGIRNTHLLYCYSQMDWRVRPLVLIVKLWAHKHNINDAKNMTISSYSLVLMVIHFLQCGVSPPVLPCLHGMYQGKFTPHSDIMMIDIHEDLTPFNSDNTQTLGELLHDFLRYYVEFDFSQYAISVRLASRVPIEECRRARTYKNDPHQWKYLCIEEPFDLTNTARSVYDRDVFERVKAVFHASYNSLKKTRDIESIFRIDEKD